MGEYTGIRFSVTLNEIGQRIIKDLKAKHYWQKISNPPFYVTEWAKFSRCNFIPFGDICYLDQKGWKYQNSLNENNWKVSCSLKNYENEIEYFLFNVLPFLIAENASVEVQEVQSEDNSNIFYIESHEK